MISRSDITRLISREAVERFVAARYGGDPDRFVADVSSSLTRYLHADLEEACGFLSDAARCFRYLPRRFKPRLTAMRARQAHWSGKSRRALALYRGAVEALLSYRQFETTARTRLGLMDVCMYLGHYDEALRQGRKALEYFRRRGDRTRSGRALTNIGNVYHRMDRNAMAMRYYDRARDCFKREGGVPLAIVDYNRANIFTNFNDIDKAGRLYRSVADVLYRHNVSLVAGKAEYSLAYLHFLADRYTDAFRGFETVLEAFTTGGYEREAAVTRLDLAEMNTYLNQFGSTLTLGQSAMEEFGRHGMRYEQAKAAYFVAEAHRHLRDFAEAGRFLRRAGHLFNLEGNELWRGMVELERARLMMDRRRYRMAVRAAEGARRLFRRSDDQRRIVDSEIVLVMACLKTDKQARGICRAGQLLKKATANYQQYGLLSLLGGHYLSRNDPRRALSYLRRAVDVVEKMLIDLYPDEIRHFFVIDKCEAYFKAAECLLKLGHVRDSFLTHSNGLAVVNQRHIPDSILRRQVPEHLLETRAALRTILKKVSRAPDPNQRQMTGLSAITSIEHRLWANEVKIRAHMYPTESPVRQDGRHAEIGPECLRRNEALVHYMLADETVGAYLMTSRGMEYVVCDVPVSTLQRGLRELHFLMENAVYSRTAGDGEATIRHYLRIIYDQLIRPLGLTNSTDRLIFLVDGLFAQVPYAALLDSVTGSWLKDRHEVRTIVSPADLGGNRTTGTATIRDRSAIFTPSLSELPLALREGDRIRRYFRKARQYKGEMATGDRLCRELKLAGGFVHVATHAARSSENPLFSQVLMSDGPFFPFDLFGTGIRAELVTLSGCQTAAPGVYYGNSFSLAKIFYQSGARHVLASLWPVSDKVSLVFMVEFYRILRETSDIAASYRMALDKASSIFTNPAFWGPFILLGI